MLMSVLSDLALALHVSCCIINDYVDICGAFCPLTQSVLAKNKCASTIDTHSGDRRSSLSVGVHYSRSIAAGSNNPTKSCIKAYCVNNNCILKTIDQVQ